VCRLRFTTVVEAPLTVAFDVARALGRPWGAPLEELRSERPVRDVYAGRRLVHSREFTATEAGTRVDELVEWAGGPSWLLARRVRAAMRAHLDAFAAAAERRALDVVQVVGAAVVEGDRVLVAQRSGGPFDGQWEFPGGKVERGESERAALVRECAEELGVAVEPQAFVGEVVLDGAVGGGLAGVSTMRLWSARLADGEPVAHEHQEVRWVGASQLDDLDWIRADRPLLPAVRGLLEP
jgi:8-oxo-dGTP diphosphatase